MSAEARCFYCRTEIDPHSRYTYQRIVGWHRAGKSGGSDISLREKRQEFACSICIDRLKAGLSPAQGSLL